MKFAKMIGILMPILQVVKLILDRRDAAMAIGELGELHEEGLLKPWEEGFAREALRIPRGVRLSVRRSIKVLQILQERRKRFHGDGVSVKEMVLFFLNNWADLLDSDRMFVTDFCQRGRDYVQLAEFNLIHEIARRLDRDFPPIVPLNFDLDRYDLAQVARLVRDELRLRRKKKRAAKFRSPLAVLPVGRVGCGNDLTPLLRSLAKFDHAVNG